MKSIRTHCFALIAVALFFPRVIMAQTIDFDFQVQVNPQPTAAAAPYNVIGLSSSSGTQTFTGLTDTASAGGYTLTVHSNNGFAGVTNAGPGDGSFSRAADGDGFRSNNEADGLITLTFSGLDNSKLYDLLLFTDSNLFLTASVNYSVGAVSQTNINATTPNTFTLDSLQPSGGELVLQIQATGSGDALTRGAALNAARLTVSGIVDASPDGDPANLTATPILSTSIRLNWADNSTNEDNFAIERWNGASWVPIGTVSENTTSYSDTGLTPGTLYSYRVKATNASGDSGYSNTANATTGTVGTSPLNVLMIVIDDMSAAAIAHPAYGQHHPSIQTPALDRLCDEGLSFTQAYSNWPACMPARQMFMGGKDVEVSQWTQTGDIQSDDGINRSLVYLHQHFQANGYNTVRLDKVFHIGNDVPNGWDITEEPFGANRDQVVTQTSELSTLGLSDNVRRYAEFTEQSGENSEIFEMAATDESGVPIDADRLTDGRTKLRALELLDDFASPGGTFDAAAKPFFLAVGFRRPHLPFVAPREYYGRYKWGAGDDNVTDPATPEIVLPPFNSAFNDEAAYRQSLEGYYACTTMTDDHVGALLDKLDATGLADNTLVIVFGDNGYGLGEHNKFFSKGTPDNVSYHVPLIVRLPDGTRINQTESKAVTLLDIYPTLVDLCGLPQPATPLDGKSFAPLINAPDPNWVEHAYAVMGGNETPSDPHAAVVWAKGYKYYERETGAPGELYAVGSGDRFEWTPLINNNASNSIEADLKARLDSLRARSAARVAPN